MNGKQIRWKIRYGMFAALVFGFLLWATFLTQREKADALQVQIVTFGDSIFGLIRDETAVPAQLQVLTGKTVYNAAFGGTCAARLSAENRMKNDKDSLSLAGVAKAVWGRDFGVQQSLRIRESNTEYFPEVIDGLEKVDFSEVETVVIQHGVNDYHAGCPIDNPEDPFDEYTFLGAIRSSVRSLKKANPVMRILLVTPTYAWYPVTGQTCEEADQGGGTLADYVEAELQAAKELGVEILDVYHDFYQHETWEDWERYTSDGIHPNEEGRRMLAERIAAALADAEQIVINDN